MVVTCFFIITFDLLFGPVLRILVQYLPLLTPARFHPNRFPSRRFVMVIMEMEAAAAPEW